jgi:pimeloyl-ACP methyl ester carboxylesterase
MSVQIAGPDDGPAVVLIHGLASDSNTWDKVIPALAAQGVRVVAVDLLGHGYSDKPARHYGLDDFAEQLNDLFAALGLESATVVGHSLGGAIAVAFGYLYPQHLDRLVLVSAGGLGREVHAMLRAASLPGASTVLNWVFQPRLVRIYSSPRLHRLLRLTPEELANLSRAGRAFSSAAGRAAFLSAVRGVIEPGGQRGSFIQMGVLAPHIPTLFVHSECDDVIPVAHARAAHEHLPGSRLLIFPGGSHEPHRKYGPELADGVVDLIHGTHSGLSHNRI